MPSPALDDRSVVGKPFASTRGTDDDVHHSPSPELAIRRLGGSDSVNNSALAQSGIVDPRRPINGPQRPNRRFGVVIVAELSGAPTSSRLAALMQLLATTSQPLAPFAARGDSEIAGLLSQGVDPLAAILPAILRSGAQERWVIVAGEAVLSPERPSDFNGPALWRARALLEEGRDEERQLAIETGDVARDARLAVLAPWVGEWLESLSVARRAVLQLVLADPRTGPAHAATVLATDPGTRISKQAISQFLRHADTRHMRALLDIVRTDATLPRPSSQSAA